MVAIDSTVAHSNSFSRGETGCAAIRGKARRSVGRFQQQLRPHLVAPPSLTQNANTECHTILPPNTQSQCLAPLHRRHPRPSLSTPPPHTHRHSETALSCPSPPHPPGRVQLVHGLRWHHVRVHPRRMPVRLSSRCALREVQQSGSHLLLSSSDRPLGSLPEYLPAIEGNRGREASVPGVRGEWL